MSLIEEVSKRCFKFYGPDGFKTYSILKVITLIEDIIVNSRRTTDQDDLNIWLLEWSATTLSELKKVEQKDILGFVQIQNKEKLPFENLLSAFMMKYL